MTLKTELFAFLENFSCYQLVKSVLLDVLYVFVSYKKVLTVMKFQIIAFLKIYVPQTTLRPC